VHVTSEVEEYLGVIVVIGLLPEVVKLVIEIIPVAVLH
jgi:hypothetical protein